MLFIFRGVSSIVRRCVEKETAKEYAVKIIDISGEKQESYQAEQIEQDTLREINILKMCDGHKHISKFQLCHMGRGGMKYIYM